MKDTYQKVLQSRLQEANDIAQNIRTKGKDPVEDVEISVANTMAVRCEKILEREYGDKIIGLADEIRKLEESDNEYSREDMSLVLAEEFATGSLSSDFNSDAKRVEASIRSSIALLTEGVVAAPIEGIGEVTIDTNDDGTDFIRIPYFGPIRSAGGTGQALSVLVADYVRSILDISEFNAREQEIERYVEEIQLYDDAVGMQYCPNDEKGRHIMENIPIMVDGQPNSNAVSREVDGYRDLERIEGNHPRDGMALVISEGIALKAPKLQTYADELDLSWGWLDKLTPDDEESEKDETDEQTKDSNTVPLRSDKIHTTENDKYMSDALAGRPIFSGPSQKGGFRLRYGRARNTGLATCGFNPATMVLVNEFIATGTQIKTEKPGKAAGAAPVTSIEGPTVKLESGELLRIDTLKHAFEVMDSIKKIVDLGEIAIPYGEFVENNHSLEPASYTEDWWMQEYNSATDRQSTPSISTAQDAIKISQEEDIPLHPDYTYLWHDINPDEYSALKYAIEHPIRQGKNSIIVDNRIEEILEKLLIPHKTTDEGIRLDRQHSRIVKLCIADTPVDEDVLAQVNSVTDFEVRPRSMTRIGCRMGRPEKSEKREMQTTIHSLFPTGRAASKERSIFASSEQTKKLDYSLTGKKKENAREKGIINTQVSYMDCPACGEETWKIQCPKCDCRTINKSACRKCGSTGESGELCSTCGVEKRPAVKQRIDLKDALSSAFERIDVRKEELDKLKGVKGLSSKTKIPEPLEKGILRSKYSISVFRDGTARYDMNDMPLTSFRPSEIGMSAEEMHDLGYTKTLEGNKLLSDEQLVGIKTQDLILSKDSGEYLLRVANYVDDLLVNYYNDEPFYEADSKEDLIGELIIGMAPHTSAGVLGRIIGYSDASVQYAHPYYHAAKRRNCDGDEDCVMLLMDGLVNFSRKYLPDQRGKNMMDAPIVMSATVDPDEIDDEAHNVDIERQYDLEFYRSTFSSNDVGSNDIKLAETKLNKPTQFLHTLSTERFHKGPDNSSYKTLGDMNSKLQTQLELADKTRGVNERTVASLVLEKHFFPDIIGNLKSFAKQNVYCRSCDTTHRRAPATGTCPTDGCYSTVQLTVYEGMIDKYLDTAMQMTDRYSLGQYNQQRLNQLERKIDSLFDDDKNQQSSINDFM
jgi:DNA polymerase II large subunit